MARSVFIYLLMPLLLCGCPSPSSIPETKGEPIRIVTTRGKVVEGELASAFNHEGIEFDGLDVALATSYFVRGDGQLVLVAAENIHEITFGGRTQTLHSFHPVATDPETGELLRKNFRDCESNNDHQWQQLGERKRTLNSDEPRYRCENCHRILWVYGASGGGRGDDSLRLDTDPVTGQPILRGTIDQDGTLKVVPSPSATAPR